MKTPHKHAELIKAWVDGAEIEYRYPKDNGDLSLWKDLTQCVFHEWYEYRLKAELSPDYTSTRRVFFKRCDAFGHYAEMENNALSGNPNNVKFIFDGETGELKSAEVIK